jgi:hypothetical protein
VTDWSQLKACYGPATEIPAMLAAAAASADDRAWYDLWSHLCHQGTVYPASYAALPLLADIAATAQPKGYNDALALAAMIVASNDPSDGAAEVDVRREHAGSIIRLHQVAGAVVARVTEPKDLVYAVQCLIALEGVPAWPLEVDRLADEQTDAECGACAEYFDVDLTGDAVTPAALADLDEGAARVHQLLTRDAGLAEMFLRLAGTVPCPRCGQTVSVPDSRP